MVSGSLPIRCLTVTSTGHVPRTCYTKPVEGEVRGCLTSILLLCSPSIRTILCLYIQIYTHWLRLRLFHQRLFRHALASDTASIALFLYLFSFSPFNKVTHLLTLTLTIENQIFTNPNPNPNPNGVTLTYLNGTQTIF